MDGSHDGHLLRRLHGRIACHGRHVLRWSRVRTEVMIKPCVCGHDEKDHDPEQEGECGEVCCCAGYCTVLADSNLPWHAALAKAQARIVELEAALGEIEAFPCDCGCVDCEAAISVAALALARKP